MKPLIYKKATKSHSANIPANTIFGKYLTIFCDLLAVLKQNNDDTAQLEVLFRNHWGLDEDFDFRSYIP